MRSRIENAADAPPSEEITHAVYLGDHVEHEVQTIAGTSFVVDPAVQRCDRVAIAASP